MGKKKGLKMKSEKVYFYSFQVFRAGNTKDVLSNGCGLSSYSDVLEAFTGITKSIKKEFLEKHDSLKKDEIVVHLLAFNNVE